MTAIQFKSQHSLNISILRFKNADSTNAMKMNNGETNIIYRSELMKGNLRPIRRRFSKTISYIIIYIAAGQRFPASFPRVRGKSIIDSPTHQSVSSVSTRPRVLAIILDAGLRLDRSYAIVVCASRAGKYRA